MAVLMNGSNIEGVFTQCLHDGQIYSLGTVEIFGVPKTSGIRLPIVLFRTCVKQLFCECPLFEERRLFIGIVF